MLRFFSYAFSIFICFILQTTLFHEISFAGIVPNLLIILTATVGFLRNEKEGLLIGFFCGLICDIFYGDVLGFQALLYMYIGFLNGCFSNIFFPEDLKLPLCLFTVSDLTYGMLNYVFLFLLRGKLNFSFYFRSIIVSETIYTVIMAVVLYPIILKIDKLITEYERKRAKKFV